MLSYSIALVPLVFGFAFLFPIWAPLFYLFPTLSHLWFSWIYTLVMKVGERDFTRLKKSLFANMSELNSSDPQLSAEKAIRILEIGAGPGPNFKFFPKNTRLIALDNNEYFKKYYVDNLKAFPSIKLERYVVGKAEKMHQIPDESVDVVVATMVLCSVTDTKAVLREIKRVLAKGGRYYAMEHVTFQSKASLGYWMQVITEPVWNRMADGCHMLRNPQKAIEKMEFAQVNLKYSELPAAPVFIKPNLMGYAVK